MNNRYAKCDESDDEFGSTEFMLATLRANQYRRDYEQERLKAEADERAAAIDAYLARQRAEQDAWYLLVAQEQERQEYLAKLEHQLANQRRFGC